MTYETNITLDLSGEQYNPPVTAMQGDKDSRYIIATLTALHNSYRHYRTDFHNQAAWGMCTK